MTELNIPMDPQELAIIHYPDQRLTKVCEEIQPEEFNAELEQLCLNMFYTMKLNGGIGLAANQVGVFKRLVVMSIPDNIVMINPTIVAASSEETIEEEGCLSIPGFYAKVKRRNVVKVAFQDVTGEHKVIEAGGIQAVCIQHELDHLDGKVFLQRLSKLKQFKAKSKIAKLNKQ